MFKSCARSVVYLSELTPMLTNGVALALEQSNGKITIRKINNDAVGQYGTPYSYYPTLKKWTVNGEPIGDDAVKFTTGEGFAMYNGIQMKNGVESYAFKSEQVPISILCSGEVDLICQNMIPANWSICGNNSPVKRYLSDFTPVLTNGVNLALEQSNGKITIRKINNDAVGQYGTPYSYYPTLKKWTTNGTPIGDTDVPFEPGEGFAIYNGIQMKNGVESYAFKSEQVPIILLTKSPLAD